MQLKFRLGKHRDGGVSLTINKKTFNLRPKRMYEDNRATGWAAQDGGHSSAYFPLPFKWCFERFRTDKTTAELVGIPEYSLHWILDEFDSSFNDLAVGSLRYHMDHAVTHCLPETRAKYEELIRRFEALDENTVEGVTDADWEAYDNDTATKEQAEKLHNGIMARNEKRRQDELSVRHDFVEIMGELWS